MNEQDVLRRIFRESEGQGSDVVIGPGDDMALLRPEGWTFGSPGGGGGGGVLLAVDQVIEGIHFERPAAGLDAIGHKAMARCLSDVAAMAGRPVASLVSAILPTGMTDDDAMVLFDAMRTVGERFHAPIVGGDLAVHRHPTHPLTCSVTVMGAATGLGVVPRFGAKNGDLVCVTGALGGSLASGRHLSFQPRVGEAILLRAVLGARLHAMIDLSDGLGLDASRMLEPDPGLQIEIDAGRLPLHDGIDWRGGVSDGEDYELLCLVEDGELPERLLECPVTPIGRVVPRPAPDAPAVVVSDGDARHDVTSRGWEHRG
ncbi:MAG: thiamine-phosphate kinase [Planctomycetota bacterium]|nr:thiamine-phosphate kinase [Planctomycetota bacterium]